MVQGIVASALHRAVESGEGSELATLLASGEEVDTRLQQHRLRGRTPLMSAVIHQGGRRWTAADLRILRSLVDAGANVNARDAAGCTALMHAVRVGADWRLVDLLLHSGAISELCDWAGWDAHAYACVRGDEQVLALLRGNSRTCPLPDAL